MYIISNLYIISLSLYFLDYEYWAGQYIGQPSDYYSNSNDVKTSIQCPYNQFGYPVSCSYTNGTSGCSAHGNEAVITCIESMLVN